MFIFVRRRTENTNAICEKTAGLRSGNISDLNSACSKMLVTVKIFQFHDMLNEHRFLGIFLGHGKRPTTAVANDLCSTRKRYLGHRVKNCQVTIFLMKPVENFKFFVFFENSLLCTLGRRPKAHHTCFSCFTGVSPPILIDALTNPEQHTYSTYFGNSLLYN